VVVHTLDVARDAVTVTDVARDAVTITVTVIRNCGVEATQHTRWDRHPCGNLFFTFLSVFSPTLSSAVDPRTNACVATLAAVATTAAAAAAATVSAVAASAVAASVVATSAAAVSAVAASAVAQSVTSLAARLGLFVSAVGRALLPGASDSAAPAVGVSTNADSGHLARYRYRHRHRHRYRNRHHRRSSRRRDAA
jgi:hypothetical protein